MPSTQVRNYDVALTLATEEIRGVIRTIRREPLVGRSARRLGDGRTIAQGFGATPRRCRRVSSILSTYSSSGTSITCTLRFSHDSLSIFSGFSSTAQFV